MVDYIKNGTRVLLVLSECAPGITATLVNRPQDVGDTYVFRQEDARLLEVQRFISMREEKE